MYFNREVSNESVFWSIFLLLVDLLGSPYFNTHPFPSGGRSVRALWSPAIVVLAAVAIDHGLGDSWKDFEPGRACGFRFSQDQEMVSCKQFVTMEVTP